MLIQDLFVFEKAGHAMCALEHLNCCCGVCYLQLLLLFGCVCLLCRCLGCLYIGEALLELGQVEEAVRQMSPDSVVDMNVSYSPQLSGVCMCMYVCCM